jgi:hypothetical protein
MFDSGYKSNLFTLAENDGFAVLIFPLLIFNKKMADTRYGGPPFILFLRYLDISQSKTMYLKCYVDYIKIWFANFYDFFPYRNSLKMWYFSSNGYHKNSVDVNRSYLIADSATSGLRTPRTWPNIRSPDNRWGGPDKPARPTGPASTRSGCLLKKCLMRWNGWRLWKQLKDILS